MSSAFLQETKAATESMKKIGIRTVFISFCIKIPSGKTIKNIKKACGFV
jgi:hypothetical protein